MFSFLDMVNHYLGYFNISVTLKSRIYTILGALGDLYLLYVAYRFLANGYLSRGLLFLLIAIVLLYFVTCNFFYYFTNKQPKFDISPALAKKFHLHPDPKKEDPKAAATANNLNTIPANGLFDSQHVLPAKIAASMQEVANFKTIVAQMEQNHLFTPNYGNLSDHKIAALLKTNGDKPVYAIGDGVLVPYFEMKSVDGKYQIYAGLNQGEILPVGHVKTVGLQDVETVNDDLKLYLASLVVKGGPYKLNGRSGIMEHVEDYVCSVRVAYKRIK